MRVNYHLSLPLSIDFFPFAMNESKAQAVRVDDNIAIVERQAFCYLIETIGFNPFRFAIPAWKGRI
jgi:hypothetical protein